ncbi:MAG: hypothetical protein IKU52_01815 [Clostridia bacterium]|nr:hypothetical protein [Clostridia bacterium]
MKRVISLFLLVTVISGLLFAMSCTDDSDSSSGNASNYEYEYPDSSGDASGDAE